MSCYSMSVIEMDKSWIDGNYLRKSVGLER